jgi:hypothetical protein
MKKYYTESRRRGISYIKYVEGRLPGLVTTCVVTAFQNTFRKERWKGQEDEEDVSSYLINLRKREDTGILKKKHDIALSGELALEEDMYLS